MTPFAKLESAINASLAETPTNVAGNANKLARMQSLMSALGNPEKSLKILHIAGTSGKTSTCYFAASLLTQAGYKTGLTISPHIDSVRERAQINLQPLSEPDWIQHMQKFFTLVKKSKVKPSYFEFHLAFAFWLFAQQKVDYVVLETGLGGTWDGSNVAREPDKICLITDIGYDHTEILGDTLEEITSNKAGIIHQHNNAYTYPKSPEILSVIQDRVMYMHSKLHIIPDLTKNFMARNFNLARHAVAFALERDHHASLTKTQIQAARQILIPARAEELIYENHQIIIDGSHNPQKLTAFKLYLDQRYPSKNRTLIATLGSNKSATLGDSMKILRQISDSIILTSFKDDSLETNKRTSLDKKTLYQAAQTAGFKTIRYIHDPQAALQTALHQPPSSKRPAPHPQIVITGSFYLLNHLRPLLFPPTPNQPQSTTTGGSGITISSSSSAHPPLTPL